MNNRSMRRELTLCVIGLLLITASSAAAQDEIPRSIVDRGRSLYSSLCASCHGENGKGDGPMVPELRAKPIDLTQIARQNNGNFPFWHVFHAIDGRSIPRAHGGPDMPVWGSVPEPIFGNKFPTEEWMVTVTFYIESIQEK
ncbi:MAG TPA: cytochrome c [Candidatus Binataceae bacterium]|nr:cytochrome c [Candidatus Binataceae bacterium]